MDPSDPEHWLKYERKPGAHLQINGAKINVLHINKTIINLTLTSKSKNLAIVTLNNQI
jgi:hypothetical protein